VFLALLERIDDRAHFGVQFDPSNAIVAGDDPVALLVEVADRVVTMQASDRALAAGATLADLRGSDGTIGYSPHLTHGVIGRGLNDYPRIFTLLAEVGYDGWISIEDGVNGMADLQASARFLLDARERYFGGSREAFVATQDAARRARTA
jgi:sugar phosphate isomerase/epimerase